ncbi:MAG: hypothetical protein COB59_03170 [Rhodospirillaceae bacterium]|nr:MAG: hypothetical protein COB59_03170 [Rhodospirillaceae bacterium]
MSTDDERVDDIAYKLKTMIAREEEDGSRAPKQSAAALRVLHELDSYVEKLAKAHKKNSPE